VSSSEHGRSSLGLEEQKARIDDYVRQKKFKLVGDFNRLDAALHRGRIQMADALVVAKLDCLSTSLLQFVDLLESSHRENWSLIALDLHIDTSTATGAMVAHILMSCAHFERELIAQRTKEGLAVIRSQGVRLGRRSTDFKELVDNINDLYDEGASIREIARKLNDEGRPTLHGGQQWYASTVSKLVDLEYQPGDTAISWMAGASLSLPSTSC
jgi:DNA invertase Pin-like site-specific DNA recombinase